MAARPSRREIRFDVAGAQHLHAIGGRPVEHRVLGDDEGDHREPTGAKLIDKGTPRVIPGDQHQDAATQSLATLQHRLAKAGKAACIARLHVREHLEQAFDLQQPASAV